MQDGVLPIIGMSPGNSYFKDEAVRFLLREVVGRNGRAIVFVADIPAIATYRAFGYDEAKARRKAILKGNNLKNRTRKIMQELGFDESVVRIIDWDTEVAEQKVYVDAYAAIQKLYATNAAFREAANETTQSVIKTVTLEDEAVAIAAQYLLSEFAFLEAAPALLSADRIAYVYHRPWPVYEEYIAGKFDGIPKPHLEFLLLAPSEA